MTFDSLSSPRRYFYESSTGVYYDPKSKLYCKDMLWHRHVPGQDPAYIPVAQQEGTASQNPPESNATGTGAAAGGSDSQASAPSGGGAPTEVTQATTSTGDGETAVAAAATAAPATASAGAAATARTAGGGKRVAPGKKQRIAFGFKGIKLVKPGTGSGIGGIGGGGGSSSSDEEGVAGGTRAGDAVSAVGGAGGLAKKRRLEDMSKWNARKLEVGIPIGKEPSHRLARVHVAVLFFWGLRG